MEFGRIVELIKEFDYEKNGEELTIKFLVFILNELLNKGGF